MSLEEDKTAELGGGWDTENLRETKSVILTFI